MGELNCGWRRSMRKPDAAPAQKAAPAPAPDPVPAAPSDNLENYTVLELKDYARDIGLTGVSTLNKTDLIAAIRAHQG